MSEQAVGARAHQRVPARHASRWLHRPVSGPVVLVGLAGLLLVVLVYAAGQGAYGIGGLAELPSLVLTSLGMVGSAASGFPTCRARWAAGRWC